MNKVISVETIIKMKIANTVIFSVSFQTLNGFFGDYTSFNILMDMLFEKGHYEGKGNIILIT